MSVSAAGDNKIEFTYAIYVNKEIDIYFQYINCIAQYINI